MYRLASRPQPRNRPAETDTSVLVLGGIVLVLLLLLGMVGGLMVWWWQRAERAEVAAAMELERAMAQREHAAAVQAEEARRLDQEELRHLELITEPRHLELIAEPQPGPRVRSYLAAGELVTVSAAGPWHVLPLLPLEVER